MTIFIATAAAFAWAVIVERYRQRHQHRRLANVALLGAAFIQALFNIIIGKDEGVLATAVALANSVYTLFLIVVAIRNLIKPPAPHVQPPPPPPNKKGPEA